MRASVDIETAIYNLLSAVTDTNEQAVYSVSAHALPATLGDKFPHVHIERTGGSTDDFVIETNQIDFDVYAADQADAMEEAGDLCAWVRNLSGEIVGTQCYAAEISTLPYNNPDPRHPNIARVTFKARILTRTKGN